MKGKKGNNMKNRVLILSVVMMSFLLLFQFDLQADESNNEITVYVNDEKVEFEIKPIIIKNRTLVPIRGVFEKLNAKVDWNRETNQVIVKDENVELLLEVGNDAVLVDGRLEFLDTQSILIEGRTLVPLRFIAEALNYEVSWNGETRRIDINSLNTVPKSQEILPTVKSKETLVQLLNYSNQLNSYIESRIMIDSGIVSNTTMQEEKAAEDYSDTNNQVEGVEEGDVVKTDGDYIYYIKNNEVIIMSTDPSKLEVVATISVDKRGNISDIYVNEGRLSIIGSSYVYYAYPIELMSINDKGIQPYYNTANTFLLTYDITEITEPTIIIDMDYEGSLVSSRLINSMLYLVTSKNFYYYETSTTDIEEYSNKPKYSNNLTNEVTIIDYSEIFYFPHYIKPNFLMTIGVDLDTKAVDVQSYLGSAENVYASLDNLYLTFTDYEYTNVGQGVIYVPNYKVNTAIYKYELNKGVVNYKTKGIVEGKIINQFSLDEYNGDLRIATTIGEMWDLTNVSRNNIFILDENLNKISELTGLAEGERIYSTRFAGERIYMVTFKQIDPFFVIDASDPLNPMVLGELKIPGFSTYMHILDENHVLGFGKDTIERDGFTQIGGVKLSLFDVTNPMVPIESKVEIIGTSGTYSELEYNHKALMISLSKGIMAFPISVASETPYSINFIGAYVYDVSDSDFVFRGTVSHQINDKTYDYDNQIQRIIYIGDYIYTLSQGKMKVTAIQSMEIIGSLEF